jgi:hypothetical protein
LDRDRQVSEAGAMANSSPPDASSDEAGQASETDDDGRRWTVARIAAVIVGLGIALFWIWILSGAPAKDNPDQLDDPAYVEALQARCIALREDIGELPLPEETPTAPERAVVIGEANDLIAVFISDVEADAPTEGDDAISMAGWLKDWKLYLANREDYVDRLSEDSSARLLVDESELGDPVDRTIQVFAEINRIPECATPGDAG